MVALAEKDVLLLMLIGTSKVYPPSALLVKNNSQFPVLLSGHTIYRLFPEEAIGDRSRG
jgi:hypothetical protein